MSSSNFTLSDFKSQVLSQGLARSNRFELLITTPPNYSTIFAEKYNLTDSNSRLVSLLCETCTLPPINVSTKPLKIFGPTYQRPYTSEYGGDGISMQFHIDSSMAVKRFFEDWIESIVSKDTFTVAYQEEYATTVYIRQLNELNEVTYEIELLEAFPRSMNLVELSNTSQNQTHRLNVILAYRYWRRTDNPLNLTQFSSVSTLTDQYFDTAFEARPRQWNWLSGSLEEGPGSDLPPAA